MLSTHQLERMLETGDSKRLVKRIMANGRCCDPQVVHALTDDAVMAVTAPALALQRLCELTYGRCIVADRIAGKLIATLEACPTDSAAAMAVAIRALLIWREPQTGGWLAERASDMIASLLLSLAKRQDDAGFIDGDPQASAIVAWQLADRSTQCAPLETQALQRALMSPAPTTRRNDVFGFARAVAA